MAEIIESAGGTMEKTRRSISQIQELNSNKLTYVIVTHENDLHLLSDVLRANISKWFLVNLPIDPLNVEEKHNNNIVNNIYRCVQCRNRIRSSCTTILPSRTSLNREQFSKHCILIPGTSLLNS